MFKIRARQLLKSMFISNDLQWIAAKLNPRTGMLKLATDPERTHTYGLVRSELAKIIGKQSKKGSRSAPSSAIINSMMILMMNQRIAQQVQKVFMVN